MHLARAVVALVLVALAAVAAARELQLIELRYRLAEEILPVVQPLLEPGGVLTGADDVLFVNTSPANFEQIRQAVEMLDRRPRQLMITVGQGTVTRDDRTDLRGTATVGSSDAQVGVNAPPGEDRGAAVGVRSASQSANLHNTSSVRTLEGTETYIAIGQLVPLTTTQVVPGPRKPLEYTSTEFRDVSTGFYATVRLRGETVTLEVSPRQQRLRGASTAPVVETAGLVSTVSGPLGEWIPLGAVQETGGGDTTGLLVWGRRSAESRYSAWVKVDEIP
jgi:type II secretory pathway component GspD/PulD (secretin)